MTDETASGQMGADNDGDPFEIGTWTDAERERAKAEHDEWEAEEAMKYAHRIRETALTAALTGSGSAMNAETVVKRANLFELYILDGVPAPEPQVVQDPPHDTAAWSGAQIAQWRNGG